MFGYGYHHFTDDDFGMEPLGDNRYAIDAGGITMIVREYTTVVRRGSITRQCEIEEIRVTTWMYQFLAPHLREGLADLITIVEP